VVLGPSQNLKGPNICYTYSTLKVDPF